MKYYKIFFSILVCFLLIVPLFHMNTDEITEQENRTLATFPKVEEKGKFNANYGKEFEAWLGDRFWGRNQLIDARFQTIYKINGRIGNERAFVGDDGWMFEKSKTVNTQSIERQRKKIMKDAQILKRFTDKFKGKNIPIYLVLIPEREVLYQKYWERYYIPKPRLDYGEEIVELLKDYPDVRIIYPKNEFLLEKRNTFLKSDNHLNFIGGKLIGSAFLKELRKLFQLNTINETWINSPKKSKRKYIANTLGITGSYEELDFSISIETNNLQENVIIKNKQYPNWPMIRKGKRKGAVLKKDILILGNCYAYDILWPISTMLFENTNFYRVNYEEDWSIVKQHFLQDLILPNEKIIILVGYDNMYKFLEYFSNSD